MHLSPTQPCRLLPLLFATAASALLLLVPSSSRAQSVEIAASKPGCHQPAGQVLEEPIENSEGDSSIQRPLDRPGFAQQQRPARATPDACQTCGVGLVAMAITATSPVSVLAALGLLAASQTGLVSSDPISPYGIPLWGFGLACAGTHLFFAGITSLAFGRDMWALCGGTQAGESSERLIEVCPNDDEPAAASSQPAVPF